tara:strand:- start:445 stop:810 length:366 start_codon:yes stop_codon:yes gene_type:complete
MTVTVVKTNQNIATSTIVKDTNTNATMALNTTSEGGTLYSIEVINPNANWVYFKLINATTGTVGTTAGELVYPATASATSSVVFPNGVYFNAGFTHWCVAGAADTSAVAPSSAVTVTYVTV